MRTVGLITTGAGAVIVVVAVIVLLVSIPDISRYLKIRKM